MRSPFSTVTLALMPIAIALNIAIGQLIATLKLPLYLDSIGTILVGVLAGPLAGGLTGLLANFLWSFLFDTNTILFAPVALVIGILAGLLGNRSWLRRLPTTVGAGLLTGVVAALISAPIAARVFGGVAGGSGTDLLVAAFQNFTQSVFTANLLQGVVSDPLDKVLSYLVVFLALKQLPRRLLVRFPQGEKSAPPRRTPLIGRVE